MGRGGAWRQREGPQVLTCLQAAMRYEEGDGAGRSSRPQHSSSPQGQRLPVQRGPLEGPLPDASSLSQGEEITVSVGAQPEPAVCTPPTRPRVFPLPGQQWPQEPWRSGTAPCPSSLGRRSRSSRSDKSAHCPQMATQGPSQPILQRGGGEGVR